jgi:cytidine deaminase
MWEFNPDMILVFEKENNKAETMLLRNLLPYPFSREGMKDE